MNILLKFRRMSDATNPQYHPNIDNFSDLWTLIRSAIESGFDYIEIEVNEK